MSTTINLGLNLPDYSLPQWNVPLNQNFTILDAAIGALHVGGAAAAVSWAKYTLVATNPNWFVNGVNVGAQSSSSGVQQIPLYTAAARTCFHAIFLKHSIAFAGGALSAIVVQLGVAATPDAFMSVGGDTFDVLQVVSDAHFYLAGGARMISAAATPLILQMTTTGGDPSVITAGTMEISILSSILP